MAIEYIKEMSEENIRTETYVNTGNIAIDSLLNDLKTRCVTREMPCVLEVTANVNDFCYKSADLAIILGNLLDNAYQAAAGIISNNTPHIIVQIHVDNNRLIIKVVNSCDINHELKEDFGIENIRSTVERLEGFYSYERNIEKAEYSAIVVLPIEF